MNRTEHGLNYAITSRSAGDICVRMANMGSMGQDGQVREIELGTVKMRKKLAAQLNVRRVLLYSRQAQVILDQRFKDAPQVQYLGNDMELDLLKKVRNEIFSANENSLPLDLFENIYALGVGELQDTSKLPKNLFELYCSLGESVRSGSVKLYGENDKVIEERKVDNYFNFKGLDRLNQLLIINAPKNSLIELPGEMKQVTVFHHEGMLTIKAEGKVGMLEIGLTSNKHPVSLICNNKENQIFEYLTVSQHKGGLTIYSMGDTKVSDTPNAIVILNPITVPLHIKHPIDAKEFTVVKIEGEGSLHFDGGFTDKVKGVTLGIIETSEHFVVPVLPDSVEVINIYTKNKGETIDISNIPKHLKKVDQVVITGAEGIQKMWIEGDDEAGVLHIERKEGWVSKGAKKNKTKKKKQHRSIKEQKLKENGAKALPIEKYKLVTGKLV